MSIQPTGRGRGPLRTAAGNGTTVEFGFGAAFTSIRAIPLRATARERLTVSDLLPVASGRYWVADARAAVLKIYSQQGDLVRTLGRGATGIRRPVSLTSFHGRWIAALDGRLPAIVILDERGRPLRRFPLPEVDRPLQICNVGDRLLAVVGSGWGRGSGRLVHLYSPAGDHVESLFGAPRHGSGRAYVAAAGIAVYLGHSASESFAIYDLEARAILSFPSLAARIARSVGRDAGFAGDLRGLFATACGPLLAVYTADSGPRRYLYDLYSLEGEPIALGLPSRERVVGVEGPLFYSVRATADGALTLNVWKLSYPENG